MKEGYVDGFVICIPKKNRGAYKKMAEEAMKVWMKFGALDYKECRADDFPADMPGMKSWGFPAMTKATKQEEVWFSFVTYKSRAHRDSVNKKVMAFFSKKYEKAEMKMPFDMKRFCYAGFKVEVGA